MFSPIQALARPCAKGWDARKSTLPTFVTKWCVREGLPNLPIFPIEPYFLIHPYTRREHCFVESEIEVCIMTMKQRPEWRAFLAKMLSLGLTPGQDMFKKIVLFFDADVLRDVPPRPRRVIGVIAFAIIFGRALRDMYGYGASPPIYVSESTSETPLPRDPGMKGLLLKLGFNVLPTDAQLLLEVDEQTAVMEVGMERIPINQIIADFSLRGPNAERYFNGPPMIVRSQIRDDIDDFDTLNNNVRDGDLPEP